MENFTFESGMDELETLVRDLESGSLPLEASFQAFERGMALKKRLEALLEDVYKRQAKSIQENVKKAIEPMSGLDVRNVDVHVQAVSFERENRAAQELKEHQQMCIRDRCSTWTRPSSAIPWG